MTFDKFTIKAQEVVQEAVNTAQRQGQQSIEPVHLLKGVLAKAKDVATFIFQKLGVNAAQVETVVDSEVQRLPRVQGGQPYLSNDANTVLQRAQDFAQKNGDEFTARPLAGELYGEPHIEGCRNDRGRHRKGHSGTPSGTEGAVAVGRRELPVALEICQEPRGRGTPRQARPRHRTRRGDTPRVADTLAPYQEQPYINR